MPEDALSDEWRDEVFAAVPAEYLGETFTRCPPSCEIPADLHRHFEREPGDYYALAAPLACCGRAWMRPDEMLLLDQCQWCWQDHGTLVPGVCSRLVYPADAPIRNAPRRRRR